MHKYRVLSFLLLLVALPAVARKDKDKPKKTTEADRVIVNQAPAVLWREPTDISSRNLYYGIGGKEHEPHAPFTFDKEDMEGTSPKFTVHDADGVKWKVKLGFEVRPEVAATRLVWAAGYSTNEDYFLPVLSVRNMPAQLQRGQDMVAPDGTMANVRLKRYLKDEKKIDTWEWRTNPFNGTREFNALRVMMALIDNWDLKDINNAVYLEKRPQGDERVFMVSDLGASFATVRRDWPNDKSKGNLIEYNRSQFIVKVLPDLVDFATPGRPSILIAVSPGSFFSRRKFEWIGRNIPRADARWLGQLMSPLSPDQIRDAFRAGGFGPGEVEGFAKVVEARIAQLREL